MFINLALIVVGIVIAVIVSGKLGSKTAIDNRATELTDNASLGELTDPMLRWAVVHIRDDIGSIYNTTLITNGLLGGILAALIAQLIR